MFKSGIIIICISSILCLVNFLLVRIADNLILSIFLRSNEIYHQYYYFFVEYRNGRVENWTEGELIFINTIPYLIAIITGIYLPHFFRNTRSRILLLAITWFSFQLVLLFLGSLVSGLFEYKGLGIALVWFLNNKSLQVIAVILTMSALTWSLRRYAWYFTRCVPNCEDIFDHNMKCLQLRMIALYPFIASVLVIISFNRIETILNHSISMFCGLMVIAMIFHSIPEVFIPSNEPQ